MTCRATRFSRVLPGCSAGTLQLLSNYDKPDVWVQRQLNLRIHIDQEASDQLPVHCSLKMSRERFNSLSSSTGVSTS